jgi:hypothetical protein
VCEVVFGCGFGYSKKNLGLVNRLPPGLFWIMLFQLLTEPL